MVRQGILLTLLCAFVPNLSHAEQGQGFFTGAPIAPELEARQWLHVDGGNQGEFSGIRTLEPSPSTLILAHRCQGDLGLVDPLTINFRTPIAPVVRLFVVNHLLPALNGGTAEVELFVDGKMVQSIEAGLSGVMTGAGELSIAGGIASETTRMLGAGTSARIAVSHNGNLVITRTFPLRGSDAAIQQLTASNGCR